MTNQQKRELTDIIRSLEIGQRHCIFKNDFKLATIKKYAEAFDIKVEINEGRVLTIIKRIK